MSSAQRSGPGWLVMIASTLIVITGVSLAAIFGGGMYVGSHHQIGRSPATERLAARVVKMNIGPEITDEQLTQIVASAITRADAGDMEAAAFVFELAARQRAAEDDKEAARRAVIGTDLEPVASDEAPNDPAS